MATRKKVWPWVIGCLIVLAGALMAGWHFFKKDLANPKSKVVKPLLTDKLKKLIIEASDSLYHIEYDKFNLNIDSGQGLITKFKLIPDTAVYHRLLTQKRAPNNLMYVSTDSLILNNFGFTKTKVGRRFNISSVTIKRPYITISNKRQSYNDTAKTGKSVLMGLVKDLLKITSVQNMTMSNMTLLYVNKNEEREKRTWLKHWNIAVKDFSIDKIEKNKTADSTNKTGKEKDLLMARVGFYQISTPDSLYRLKFYNNRFFPDSRSMYAKQFILEPRFDKVNFYRKSGFDRDRYHFIYNDMAMRNIDIERLLKRQQIHVGLMTVGSAWLEVFNNYHWPKRLRPIRYHVYPQEQLQTLAFDITVDTMAMHNTYFQYTMAAKKSEETAKLFMTHIESRIYNMTNNAARKKANPHTASITHSLMMGAAPLTSKYVFNLVDKDGAFTYEEWMGKMDARAANPVAAPLGMMAVKSGTIDKMYVRIDANEQLAKGHVDLYYHDLKINLLKRDDKADTLKKRGFLSFLTNAVMPDDNPKKNGKFRQGPIYVKHDPRMSFFGLMWKCMQDGMSSATTGIDQNKKKPDGNIAIKVIKKIISPFQKKKYLKKDQKKDEKTLKGKNKQF